MTKVEMLAKLKTHKGVGVQVITNTGNEVCYFYEDMEGSTGISRALKQVQPMMDKGKFAKVTFVA